MLPPKFPVLFTKHRLCRSFDRPLTLDHASALRQPVLNQRLHARKRFLRDHIPSSSQTGSQLIRLSALGVCLYLSLHWKSLYEKYTEILPPLSSGQQFLNQLNPATTTIGSLIGYHHRLFCLRWHQIHSAWMERMAFRNALSRKQ